MSYNKKSHNQEDGGLVRKRVQNRTLSFVIKDYRLLVGSIKVYVTHLCQLDTKGGRNFFTMFKLIFRKFTLL